MSSPSWDTIPLVALKCILEHLDAKDVFAALGTCQHWRSVMLIYEPRRPCLKLDVMMGGEHKNDFLARTFKKHTKKLYVNIHPDVDDITVDLFTCYVLPLFLDSISLQEIIFVGPIYNNLCTETSYAKIRRVVTETLIYKHSHILEKLAVFGCEFNIIDDTDRYVTRQMTYYSKSLSFHALDYFPPTVDENTIITRHNLTTMLFSNIKHIVFEYDLISIETLITLSKMDNLKVLSLNIISERFRKIPVIDWEEVTPLFDSRLEVAVNIIALSPSYIQYVINTVFSAGLPLTSLKVMFCKIFFMRLVHHITQKYHKTLTEFSWTDRPLNERKSLKTARPQLDEGVAAPYNHVNPFIYLAWQCKNLRKLTIHGYWMCEYDLLGIIRLRPHLEIDVSSIYDSRGRSAETPHAAPAAASLLRVLAQDPPPDHSTTIIRYSSDGTHERGFKSRDWADLPAGLKARSSDTERAEYIVDEILHPLGIT